MRTTGPREGMDPYFRGEKLYGDDFTLSDITKWYEDEREAYSGLNGSAAQEGGEATESGYSYFALNQRHGFRHVPPTCRDILSVGGSYGAELLPVAANAQRIVILEPSQSTRSASVAGVPVEYASPRPDGMMPFPDACFDLITCFGALHHIANVSTVVGEIFRCIRPGGYALVREPTISMGDWRFNRDGLTKRERGIPPSLFREIVTQSGFQLMRETRCIFSLVSRLQRSVPGGVRPFNIPILVLVDQVMSYAFSWNKRYHRTTVLEKLGPTSMFLVLRRPMS